MSSESFSATSFKGEYEKFEALISSTVKVFIDKL